MTYSFTTLTDTAPGFLKIDGIQINNLGQVVATEASFFGADSIAFDTFIYNNGMYSTLDVPSGANSNSTVAINNNGVVVGNYDTNVISGPNSFNTEFGFLYSNGTSTTLADPSAIIGSFNGTLATNGTAVTAVNDSGEVVGTYVDSTGTHGFLYSNGTYTTLDAPSTTSGTVAVAINDNGQVVGDFTDATNTEHGFIFSNGTYLTLTDPLATTHNGNGTSAVAVNNSGQVVGDYKDVGNNSHGYLYSNGTFVSIDDPNGQAGLTFVVGINNIGEVIGNSLNASGVEQGFVYSGGTYTPIIDPLGTQGTFLQGINDLGQIVGYYVDSNGSQHAFEVTPPAPNTWTTGTAGDWSTAADWSSGTAPSATDDAAINNTNTVTVNGTAVANSLTLDNSQLTISGTLTLGTSLTLNGDDQLLLNGGTLSAQSVTSDFLGSFIGHGTISITGAVSGFIDIEAAGGTLKVDGPLAGQVFFAGNELAYSISLGATLELSNGTASQVGFTQNGFVNGIYQEHPDTLKLDMPAAFTGSISNISVGDMIDLSGITASSATISGSTLTINESGGQQLIYHYGGPSAFNASIDGDSLLVGSDTNGGTLVYVAAPAPTEATTIQQEIAGLYAAVYNRTADSVGMQYWDNVVAEQSDAFGVTAASAANTPISTNDAALLGQLFVATQSAYFNQAYGSLNDSDFVNALYFNMGGQNAETSSAIAYWVNIIQAGETSGLSIQNARAAMVGQFVHDLIDVNLAQWTSVLTPSELETAILRQAVVDNKLAVSLAYVNASANPNGSFLNAHVVGDAAFQAQVTALTGMVINPLGVSVETTAIHNAVSDHNLVDIQPVGILMPQPVA